MSINWNAKLLDPKDLTKYGKGGFVIPAPLEVDALMKKLPKGKLTSINELRTALAKKHKTDFTCPITTGIFSWIAAYAAVELAQQGRKRITPYWRTLKSDGQIIPKYPGGIEAIRGKLEAEGQTVTQKGKRFLVENLKKDHRPETGLMSFFHACSALGQAGLMAWC